MPIVGTYGTGDANVSKAASTSRGQLDTAANTTVFSRSLQTIGMPKLYVWVHQLSPIDPAMLASVTLQYAVRSQTSGDLMEWLDLTLPVVLPINQPGLIFQGIEFPAARIRLKIVAPAGATAGVVSYTLGCSG
jgi:hypothetical protein